MGKPTDGIDDQDTRKGVEAVRWMRFGCLSWSRNPRSGRQGGKISVLANDGHPRPQTGWTFTGTPRQVRYLKGKYGKSLEAGCRGMGSDCAQVGFFSNGSSSTGASDRQQWRQWGPSGSKHEHEHDRNGKLCSTSDSTRTDAATGLEITTTKTTLHNNNNNNNNSSKDSLGGRSRC